MNTLYPGLAEIVYSQFLRYPKERTAEIDIIEKPLDQG